MLRGGHFYPTENERIEILKRLLKLARAGKCGAIYCSGDVVRIGTDEYGHSQRITWLQAKDLSATWVEPLAIQRKPVGKSRTPRLPIRKRA